MKWYVFRASDKRAQDGPPCISARLDARLDGYGGDIESFYVIEGDESTPVKVAEETACRVVVNLKGREWCSSCEGGEVYESMPCIIIYDDYLE